MAIFNFTRDPETGMSVFSKSPKINPNYNPEDIASLPYAEDTRTGRRLNTAMQRERAKALLARKSATSEIEAQGEQQRRAISSTADANIKQGTALRDKEFSLSEAGKDKDLERANREADKSLADIGIAAGDSGPTAKITGLKVKLSKAIADAKIADQTAQAGLEATQAGNKVLNAEANAKRIIGVQPSGSMVLDTSGNLQDIITPGSAKVETTRTGGGLDPKTGMPVPEKSIQNVITTPPTRLPANLRQRYGNLPEDPYNPDAQPEGKSIGTVLKDIGASLAPQANPLGFGRTMPSPKEIIPQLQLQPIEATPSFDFLNRYNALNNTLNVPGENTNSPYLPNDPRSKLMKKRMYVVPK